MVLRRFRSPVALALVGAAAMYLTVSCARGGNGTETAGSVIVLTLQVPGASEDRMASLGERLLQTFRAVDVGEITGTDRKGTVLEVTIQVRELAAINRVKKAVIDIAPSAEYRIEHR